MLFLQAGFSALMIAAKSGNLEILQVLINAEAILDLKSKHGLTALMYAVQNKSEQAAKKLLLAGADGSARDKGGKTVVEMAEERGCGEIVRLLKRQTAVTNTSVSWWREKRGRKRGGGGKGGKGER